MLIVVKSLKKMMVVCFLLFLVMLISSMIWRGYAEEVKADKSNAMQVVKVFEPETQAKIDFFTEYRLERDKIRSEHSDMLRETIKNATSEEERHSAQESVLKMVQEKQRETEVENLIKAKGFADALVFLRENSANAIVKANTLTKEEVIQVADVICRMTSVKQEDITISAKP
ncbi:SpoIIIAH-like family protein [Anaerosinus massiliensis]|uniref:SpoIIIAH-like family protein n=1 Tax=Massilibacillus massiliensis TaxID=1806837 RepID=UPI000A5B6C5E|nr:SpoIIIAH-like family protein [Massilibacillus massiliensis]